MLCSTDFESQVHTRAATFMSTFVELKPWSHRKWQHLSLITETQLLLVDECFWLFISLVTNAPPDRVLSNVHVYQMLLVYVLLNY